MSEFLSAIEDLSRELILSICNMVEEVSSSYLFESPDDYIGGDD